MKAFTSLGRFSPYGEKAMLLQPKNQLKLDYSENSSSTYYLFAGKGDEHEEEIYWSQNFAIWSSGQSIKRSYTLSSTVLSVIWASFSKIGAGKDNLCILHEEGMNVYDTCSGQHYSCVFPCRINKIWALEDGILLGRDTSIDTDSKSPTLFSMFHPLEEIKPLSYHVDQNVSKKAGPNYYVETTKTILLISTSVVVFLDSKNSEVSFWLLHREINDMELNYESSVKKTKNSEFFPPIVPAENQESLLQSDLTLQCLHTCSHAPTGVEVFEAHDPTDSILLWVVGGDKAFTFSYDIANMSVTPEFEIPALGAVPVCAMRPPTLFPDPKKVPRNVFFDTLVWEPSGALVVYIGKLRVGPYSLPNLPTKLPSPQIEGISDAVADRFNVTIGSPVVPEKEIFRLKISLVPKSQAVQESLRGIAAVTPFPLSLALLHSLSLWEISSSQFQDEVSHEWERFSQIILTLMGDHPTPSKEKPSLSDWEFLLTSEFHSSKSFDSSLGSLSLSQEFPDIPTRPSTLRKLPITPKDLEPFRCAIVQALHLVYETFKLNTLTWTHLPDYAKFLGKLTQLLGWSSFSDYYYRDFPSSAPHPNQKKEGRDSSLLVEEPSSPFDALKWLSHCLEGHLLPLPNFSSPFTPLEWLRKICLLYSVLHGASLPLSQDVPKLSWLTQPEDLMIDPPGTGDFVPSSLAERVVKTMVQEGFSKEAIECLPFGVSVPLRECLRSCRHSPPPKGPKEFFLLIGREDILQSIYLPDIKNNILPWVDQKTDLPTRSEFPSAPIDPHKKTKDGTELENSLSYLIFSKDMRLEEVQKILSSSRTFTLPNATGTETEIEEEHQSRLYHLVQRAVALPVARGMVTMATSTPLPTDVLEFPPLVFSGKVAEAKTTVSLEILEKDSSLLDWPKFHHGVAVGLRRNPDQGRFTAESIIGEESPEMAGVFLGLGLLKLLPAFSLTQIYEYLSGGEEITRMAILLGLSAEKRGSMDRALSKVLAVHLAPFVPPSSSSELDVPSSVQTVALMGVGLLYEGTAHRRMTEILLEEIGKRPIDSLENRASYSLTAGIALGMVTLGTAGKAFGLADLQLEDHLTHYIHGGTDLPKISDPKTPMKSMLVQEMKGINVDITAPGAILALGLMYIQTNNKSIASRLSLPSTPFLLEFVRPDILLLRVVGKNLILWDSIVPTEEWVTSQVPLFIQDTLKTKKKSASGSEWEVWEQAHASILAGVCFSIGLRFAGSCSHEAKTLLTRYVYYFMDLLKGQEEDDPNGMLTETCLNVATLSLSLVMAGTGDLDSFKLLRRLCKRVGGPSRASPKGKKYSYGNHMATHMAVGFLFLGGGRYSISSSKESIATLLASLYPQFPTSSSDNRYHLQAFRHLYVLSAQPRCLETKDIDTQKTVYVPLEISLKPEASPVYPDRVIHCMTPCLLPEFHLIEKISVATPRYWNLTLDSNTSISLLTSQKILFVKRKTGYLSYMDDPLGYRSILSRPFPKSSPTDPPGRREKQFSEFLQSFSADPHIIAFAELFCSNDSVSSAFFTSVLYECLTQSKSEILPTYLSLFEILQHPESLTPLKAANLALIHSFYSHLEFFNFSKEEPLLQLSFLETMKRRIEEFFEEKRMGDILREYVKSNGFNSSSLSSDHFGSYLVYYNIPSPNILRQLSDMLKSSPSKEMVLPFLTLLLKSYPHSTILKLSDAFS